MDKKLKVIELFGGIGSPRMALERLGIDTKHIDYVEILDFAVLAYNKLFNNDFKPDTVVDWNLDIDILYHGSPCQDFSVAGKNDLSSGRSILYKETLEIIGKRLTPRPKVVIWENVKGLVNKNNIEHFNHYIETMESYGYKSTWKILEGTDFNVAQTRPRIFVISIHKDSDFDFDWDTLDYKPLDHKLDKYLENHDDVDDWYYFKESTPSMSKAVVDGKIKIVDKVAQTITTKQWRWNSGGVILVPLYSFNQENYVRLPEKAVASTITAGGANSRQKIAVDITTTKKRDGAQVFEFEGKFYYIRILTERECWRLMGFRDNEIDRVFNSEPPITRSGLYSLAGNSIIVDINVAIFKRLLKNYI